MSIKVIGEVNLAYLFALSQFFMAWTMASLYVKAAGNFVPRELVLTEGAPARQSV
jgi:uncharacterized membrane protein (DUF485 family)